MNKEIPLSEFELVVHIGTGKTGTSSVQKTLADQGGALRQQDAAYLGLMLESAPQESQVYAWMVPGAGGWLTFKSLEPAVAAKQLQDALSEALIQLKKEGFKTAIWSNESLFSDGAFIVPILGEIYKLGAKIKVVVYIRRHDTWARSAYLQWGIKHKTYPGPVKNFQEWNKTHAINFSSGLKPWLNHDWLKLIVRNFDACPDVVSDFLAASGLDPSRIEIRRDNETPNSVALALWGLYNSQFEEPVLPVELQLLLQKSGLLGHTPVGCDFTSLLPTSEDIERVVETAAEDRDFVNQLFAQNNQPEMPTGELNKKDLAVSQEQINAALLMLIKYQYDRIAWLTKQVRTLKEKVGE